MQHTTAADVIINTLKDQANSILSAALGSSQLQAFNIGSKGNLPYYWQDPRNLLFNAKTYDWISSNLKAGTSPFQLDQSFTNLYIDALTKISYSLSTSDQAQLNAAKANATNQQAALLNAWQGAFGSLPSAAGKQPIDLITGTIATEWADPPTTLPKIQQSINLNALLNNVPASGATVVPVFANWLNAIGAAVSLENNTTLNNAYLAKALAAAQTAAQTNGGLQLDTNAYVPSYKVANQLSDILNGLQNQGQATNLSMTVSRSTENDFQVSVSGGTSFGIPVLDFLTLNVGGNASYFKSDVATTSNETKVTMNFPGVTLVNFGPSSFDMATLQNWFWTQPITDAMANGDKDVSGFKFAPKPQIDFSASGPFGYLQGVAISNYPSMIIQVTSSDYQRIQQTFQQSASVGVSFLGIPLGINMKESSYSNKVTVDSSSSTVTITLDPPKELVAGDAVDSVGWILGVQPVFPAA